MELVAKIEREWLGSKDFEKHQAGFCSQWLLDNSCKYCANLAVSINTYKQVPQVDLEEIGEGCGFFCSSKSPHLRTRSQRYYFIIFLANCIFKISHHCHAYSSHQLYSDDIKDVLQSKVKFSVAASLLTYTVHKIE